MNAPDRAAWLAERRTGIGGSDIAAILGVSPYRSAVDVWLDKTGQAAPLQENEAMYWGTVLEDVVANEYSRRNQIKVERIKHVIRDAQRPWMLANIDRVCWQDGKAPVVRKTGEIRSRHLLECKTASTWKARQWEYADSIDDEPLPVEYTAQAMWYMAITGAEICDVAVLIGGQHYAQRRVERDEETIRAMIERAEAFWFAHVVSHVAPAPSNGDDALALFPSDDGSSLQADESLVMAIDQAKQLNADIKELDAQLTSAKDFIKAQMGAAAFVGLNGQTLATWKASRDSVETDWQAAYLDLNPDPSHINRFKSMKPGTRRFVFK